MKILLVDDSPVARMILKKTLSPFEGLDLRECGTYQETMDAFRSFQPDLTFLDLTMPDKNGIEILEEMLEIRPDALVAIVSADRQKHSVSRTKELGAYTFLAKPPSRETVGAVVESAQELLEART
jgi:two-component system chemotaxis response regulator CheY